MDNQDPNTDNLDPTSGSISTTTTGGDGTTITPEWYSTLGSDLSNNPSITKFGSVDDLAKSYVSAQSMIGKDKVVVPSEDNPDSWNEYYDRGGRPENASKYNVPQIDSPEGTQMGDNHLEVYKQKAYELGLNDKQFQGLYELQTDMNRNGLAQAEEGRNKSSQDSETSLRGEWGNAYDAKMEGARNLITQYGDENLVNFLNESGLGNNQNLIKFLDKVGSNFGEDVLQGKPTSFTKTPAEAQREINAMLGDNLHPYFTQLHPDHDAAVELMTSLTQMANPDL